jgi:hypothetical protein
MAFAALALLVLAGAIGAVQLSANGHHRTDGPLTASDEVRITYELDAGQSTTWGMPLDGALGKVVVLNLIEPLNVEGLDVVGIQTCSGWAPVDGDLLHCAPLNSSGWPPDGVAVHEVAGTVIGGTPDSSVGVLIGLQRQPGASIATISGVRVVYTVEGVKYEVLQPWYLQLVPADGVLSVQSFVNRGQR